MADDRPMGKAVPLQSSRDAYIAAREFLNKKVYGAAGTGLVTIPVEMAKHLLRAYPPTADVPPGSCVFSARLVPFLRHAISHEALLSSGRFNFDMGGITVTPHPDGGVVLVATNGRVMLLARDLSGKTSEGGVRLIMPPDAMDACKAPEPARYHDQGDIFEAPMPVWMIPETVFSAGASLMVIPKEQPDDPGRHEDDGVMLWAGGIETSNVWREDDFRRVDPVKWWHATKLIAQPRVIAHEPVWISTEVIGQVADAMRALPDILFWQAHSFDKLTTVWVPSSPTDPNADGPRTDVAIVAAGAHNLHDTAPPPWLWDCVPEAAPPAAA